jgi:hypothetical protein
MGVVKSVTDVKDAVYKDAIGSAGSPIRRSDPGPGLASPAFSSPGGYDKSMDKSLEKSMEESIAEDSAVLSPAAGGNPAFGKVRATT